jgi:ankyrin repeat protein
MMSERLCEEGADDPLPRKRKAVSEEERLDAEKRLLRSCEHGSLADVRTALSTTIDVDVNCLDEAFIGGRRTTPLLWACRRLDWSAAELIVCELLSHGAAADDRYLAYQRDARKQLVAIHVAASHSSCAVTKTLLDAHSSVNSLCGSLTPLHYCCMRDDGEAVSVARVLLDAGAWMEQRDSKGGTPLLIAAQCGSPTLVGFLLSRGADISALSNSGSSALMRASGNVMHGAAIVPLLVQAGVDVNFVSSYGSTALLHVCKLADDDALNFARALLESGAQTELRGPVHPTLLTTTFTPLLVAARFGTALMVELLLSRGADVHSCSSSGRSALRLAASNRHHGLAIIPLLLNADAGLDVDAIHSHGDTLLSYCCARSHDELSLPMVRLLLDRGAGIEHRSKHGETPCMLASLHGPAALVELLLSRHADANARDSDGKTALMYAAENRLHALSIIPLLINAGCDVAAVSTRGRSVLGYAFCRGSAPIMRALAPFCAVGGEGHDLGHLKPICTSSDPIGCFREGAVYGAHPVSTSFAKSVAKFYPAYYSWAVLRLSFNRAPFPEIFPALEQCQNAVLWRWAGLELLTTRHRKDGLTLLHVAARANNAIAVHQLQGVWMNPLLRDREGRRAVELTTDAGIRASLSKYAVQLPRREVMRWYGPGVIQRARTCCLVMQRWRSEGVCDIPKDVVRLIIMQLMALESASSNPDSEVGNSWALLRAARTGKARDPFIAIRECQESFLWHWAGIDQLTSRDLSGGTLLHSAARANNVVGVRSLMRTWMNPWLRDMRGYLAVDLVDNDSLRAELIHYAAQLPRREVMRWYGPYLIERLRAFLLVVQRWRKTGLRKLPMSVLHLIIAHVRALEYV